MANSERTRVAAIRPSAVRSDSPFLDFVLRWWWVVLLGTLLGAAGGFAYLENGPASYQSTAFLVVTPSADPNGEPLVTSNPSRFRALPEVLVSQATSPPVYQSVSRALLGQIDVSPAELALAVEQRMIDIRQQPNSPNFIGITVTDPDPERARLLASGYAKGFVAYITEQVRLADDQRRREIEKQIELTQQQVASLPIRSSISDPAVAQTIGGVLGRLLQSMIENQVRLRMDAPPQVPLERYGEASEPVPATNARRVLIAGTGVGGVAGIGLAYLLELLRQWLGRRGMKGRSASTNGRVLSSELRGQSTSPIKRPRGQRNRAASIRKRRRDLAPGYSVRRAAGQNGSTGDWGRDSVMNRTQSGIWYLEGRERRAER